MIVDARVAYATLSAFRTGICSPTEQTAIALAAQSGKRPARLGYGFQLSSGVPNALFQTVRKRGNQECATAP